GGAITTVDAEANFENPASLFGNPYVEDGISFSRTNLSFNNNGCGFAGCHDLGGSFDGNYLYGAYRSNTPGQPGPSRSDHGFSTFSATGGRFFEGIEFVSDAGFGVGIVDDTVYWEAYRLGALIGSGLATPNAAVVLGFHDDLGFDELRYTRWSYEVDAP